MKIKNNKNKLQVSLNKDKILNPVKLKTNSLTKKSITLKKENLVIPSLQKNNLKVLPRLHDSYSLRHFPPAIKAFLNSVYSFNKSFVRNLPQADNVVFKLIKGYFTLNQLSNNKDGKRSKLLVRRYKKLSLNRVIVSKPEIKHSADKVMITVYVYNKKRYNIIYRLKQLYNSLLWGKLTSLSKNTKDKAKLSKFLPLIKAKKEEKILNKYKNYITKKNIKTLTLNKVSFKSSFTKAKAKKNSAKNLIINTSYRYNLKMNYLLDQDREYTASYRSFRYANKKIYIVIARKFNFYVKNTDNIKFIENKKSSVKKLNNISFINNIRKVYIEVNPKRNIKLRNRKNSNKYLLIKLLKIKPRTKSVKIRNNILMYKNLSYINRKKRFSLFNRYKTNIIYKGKIRPLSRKKYNKAIQYKNLSIISFKSLAYHGLALKSNKKNNLLLYNDNKPKNNLLNLNTKFKPLHVELNPITKNRVGKAISLKRNLLNNLYKPVKLSKKGYKTSSLISVKYNNKYLSSLKFKYNPYKGLNTNNLNSIILLNKLNKLDLAFTEKTGKFNNTLSNILQDNSFTNTNVNNYNISNINSSLYVKLKYMLKVKLLGELLHREMLYTYYVRSLYVNSLLFKTGFINSLCNMLSKVYNKKVILNIVSLKYLYFNSDIFTQAITTRLKNHRKNRLNKVLNKVFGLVYLAKINEYAFNIHNPIYKYMDSFNNKYKHLRSHLAFTNNAIVKSYNKGLKPNILKKLRGLPLYNLNHILTSQINFIKCKSVFGIKLEAKGRLTKRSTASRKIFKVKYLGNLRFNNTLNKSLSSSIIKNNMISNVQFTKIAGKTRIGSFGIKGWINNN